MLLYLQKLAFHPVSGAIPLPKTSPGICEFKKNSWQEYTVNFIIRTGNRTANFQSANCNHDYMTPG